METNNSDKYLKAIADCNVCIDDAKVSEDVAKLIADNIDKYRDVQVYKFLLNCVDLTTLSSTDSEKSVTAFTQKVNDFEENYPEFDNVGAICVYANFANVVRSTLEVSDVKIAVCSANFPSSQARIELKTTETALALADGSDELDFVLNLGLFYDKSYEVLSDKLCEIKHYTHDALSKVII